MAKNSKFYLECKSCGEKIDDFSDWFAHGQKCPKCGCLQADVQYYEDFSNLVSMVKDPNFKPNSLWDYFNFMPVLNRENIISEGFEGVNRIDNWTFFEAYAKRKYNLNIKVYAHRQDTNYATGTFKDLAGTVVASVLKENKVKNYVGASTGNIGVAYSRYLAAAGISLTLFIPESSTKTQEAEVSTYGQTLYRVKGDYAAAKDMAKKFAQKFNLLLTGGNFDPMRIEAKKTMVYEWLRVLPHFPTVFMQAISGGSGPLGIAKSCKELEHLNVFDKMPRFILPQPHRCAPMAEAWANAKKNNFPEGWAKEYPVYENPETTIVTLATGNPTAYPPLAELVKQSNGEIISCIEEKAMDVTKLVAYETTMRVGPAAAITVVGFLQSLREGTIKDGDVVMLNIGESTWRSPEYVAKLSYSTRFISSVDETELIDREVYRKQLWDAIESI